MDKEDYGDRTRSRTGSACSTKDHAPSKISSGQLLDNNARVVCDTDVKQREEDESHPSKRNEEKQTRKALASSSEGTTEASNGKADQDDVELALEKKQSRILATDPNLVTWDGPDDGENPKNWTTKRRWAATLVVSAFTLISPVSSSMVAPALPAIAKDLEISNEVESQMVLSIFVLAYAIGPLFLGPLSEVYGRIPVLQITNLVYLVFNTAAGGCKTKEQMIAFRFFSGLGGVAAQVVGGGVLSDCWKAEQRARAMAIYSLAPLLGPAIGPIAGGFITENTTWRWSFYATSIADVLVWVSGLFFLRETYPPKLLHLKAKKLRQGTGNKDLHTEYEKVERNLFDLLSRSLVRPFRLLGTQPIVQVLAVYMAYIYGLMYLVLSTFPVLWADRYHESVGIVGLNYISMGLGFMIGAQVFAPLNDRIYRILTKRNDGVGKPEYRVPTMVPGSVLVPIGLFIYAWTAQYHTHWIGPNIGVAIFSVGAIASFQVIQTYIIDAYTLYAASALAAVTVLRSLGGFGFPLFAPYMYNRLDYGWGNSLLAFIAIGLGIPAPFLLWIMGESLRKRSPFAAGG